MAKNECNTYFKTSYQLLQKSDSGFASSSDDMFSVPNSPKQLSRERKKVKL